MAFSGCAHRTPFRHNYVFCETHKGTLFWECSDGTTPSYKVPIEAMSDYVAMPAQDHADFTLSCKEADRDLEAIQ